MKSYSISLCMALLIGLTSCSTSTTVVNSNTDSKTNSSTNSTTSNNVSSVISEDKKQNDGSTRLSVINLSYTDESGSKKDLVYSDIKSIKVGTFTLTSAENNSFSVKIGDTNLVLQYKEKGVFFFKTPDISKLNLNEFIKKGSIVTIETNKNFSIEINTEIVFKQLLSLAAKSNLTGIEPVMGQLYSPKVNESLSKLDDSSTNIIYFDSNLNTNTTSIIESDKDLKPVSGGSKLIIVKGGMLKSDFTLPAEITLNDELTLHKDCFVSKGSKLSIKNKLPSDLTLNGDNSLSNDYKVSTDITLLKGSLLLKGTILKSGNDSPKMLFVDANSVLFDDNFSSFLKNKKLQ